MTTGSPPAEHGIVANGWYDRDAAEVRFWQRSGRLVRGEQVWDAMRRRDPTATCLNMFWWFNSYSTCDFITQARPIYKADGRKLEDCYTQPAELRDRLQGELGVFPLFRFWGPGASIASSRWIARAARLAHGWHDPTLTLVYLPHLDYPLQKLGPEHPSIPAEVAAVDEVAGDLLDDLEGAGVRCLIVSEYGIESTAAGGGAVDINRVLRGEGLLAVREEDGLELLDPGACRAFAVADHQAAHVYVRDEADVERAAGACRSLVASDGVERVLGREAQRELGLDHARAGELLLIARAGRWFTYDYWMDDAKAPDFARTVDIHRKPGYDPRELFLDPSLPMGGKLRLARRLAQRKLGMRALLDVIPLDPSLVRGTHGRVDMPVELQPLMVLPEGVGEELSDEEPSEAVKGAVLEVLFA